MAYGEKLAARMRTLLADRSDADGATYFGGLTFLVGRHTCCGVQGDELILRLGPEGQKRRSPAHTLARWTSPAARCPVSSRYAAVD